MAEAGTSVSYMANRTSCFSSVSAVPPHPRTANASVAVELEKKTMSAEVGAVTDGSTPSSNISGLRTMPPPMPSSPATTLPARHHPNQ
jgi:hypothetical protein